MTLSFYRIALGALADIATMTPAELADGVAQRKALRIYHELLGAMADGSRGPAPRCATCVHDTGKADRLSWAEDVIEDLRRANRRR